MPKPVMANEDLKEIVRTAVFSQRVASPDIEFDIEAPDCAVMVKCDGRLIAQALGNILKNAAESIGVRNASDGQNGDAAVMGRVRMTIGTEGGVARVSVADNGVGLPKAERHRLTEPYMTTRAKGTGLGLAIVKKVAEEHGGALFFDDCDQLGPTGAIVSLTLPLEAEGREGLAVVAAE